MPGLNHGWKAGKVSAFFALAMAAAACTNSAPAASGNSVRIQTEPAGALAVSEYGDSCLTPCSLSLPVSNGGVITVSRDGYQARDIRVLARNAKAGTYFGDDDDPVLFGLDTLIYAADAPRRRPHLDTNEVALTLQPLTTAGEPAGAPEAPYKQPAVIEPK